MPDVIWCKSVVKSTRWTHSHASYLTAHQCFKELIVVKNCCLGGDGRQCAMGTGSGSSHLSHQCWTAVKSWKQRHSIGSLVVHTRSLYWCYHVQKFVVINSWVCCHINRQTVPLHSQTLPGICHFHSLCSYTVNFLTVLWSPYGIGRPYIFSCCGLFFLLMAAPCNRGAIIFLPCSFFLSIFFYLFFPRLISAATDWISTILLHMAWP